MLRLVHHNRIPYGGNYILKDPNLGMVGVGNDFDKISQSVRDYRKANGIPIGLGFADELESYICSKYPNECHETDPNFPKEHRITWKDVVNGTQRMWDINVWKAMGNPMETPEEANRRAEICSKCKWNKPFSRPCGWVCAALKAIVDSTVGSRKTKFDKDLESCSICHCFLSAAVWAPLELQCKGVDDRMRNQFATVTNCWKQCPPT